MTRTTAILGKGGSGKTFVAAHVAMSLGYMGLRTLLVGCDQKNDATRALSTDTRKPLLNALEEVKFAYDELALSDLIVKISDYVDVIELGGSQLLVGHYGNVLDEAFHTFDIHQVWDDYEQVIFDMTDERFDATSALLFRKVQGAIAVTTEETSSLFILNRLLRAILIGANEYGTQMQVLGVINNRSTQPRAFERYTELTRIFPLMTVPSLKDLATLRPFHRTLLTLAKEPPHLKPVVDGFIRIADLLRVDPFVLYPLSPMADEDIWGLEPPMSLDN